MIPPSKNDIIRQLQQEVHSLQGFRSRQDHERLHAGLGPIEAAFPEQTFPTGAVHEFLSYKTEDAAATNGFISGIVGKLMQQGGSCLWIGTKRTLFAPALKAFGIEPHKVIFIDLIREKDSLWALEEALKCEALSAVVSELSEISFTESRRLQLAVEQSHVTGFIHRYYPKVENTVACVSRWKITPLPSVLEPGMPGVGFPRWKVQLLKIRNGKTGTWQVEWAAGNFRVVPVQTVTVSQPFIVPKTA